MSPNVRRPIDYWLSAVIVALSTLLSLGMLVTVPRNPKSDLPARLSACGHAQAGSAQAGIRNPKSEIPNPKFLTTTIPLTTGVAPWPRALAVDESLGLAYLADGERGTVTIVAGTALVGVIPVGQEVADVAVDAGVGFVYASAPDPYALFGGHIAVIRGGEAITHFAAGGHPGPIAIDSQHNWTYVGVRTAVPYSDYLTILQRDRRLPPVNTPPGIVALDVDPERGRAYVVSEAGPSLPSLSIIDRTANTAVVSLDEVGVPRDVGVDPTSGLVYVVGQSPFRDAGTVLVISDTQQIARLPAGPDPRHVAVDSQHGRVYVSNAGDDTLTIIAGTEVIGTVGVGPAPGPIAVDPARDRVYVSNAGDGTTTVLSGQEVVATLPAGGGPLAVDAERGVAYLAGNGLAVAQGDSLLGRLPKAAMPARLAVNPETGLVYTANQGADAVSVISDTEVLTTLRLSNTPRAVAADPVSGWVYVAQDDGELMVMRGATVRATLPITARDIALDPARDRAYAASDGVAVIQGTDLVDPIDLGQAPRGVAVNRATGLAYATAGGHDDGFVAVISGTERIATVNTGGAPGELVVDPARDRVFVLHPSQGRLSVIQGTQRHFPSIYLPRPALDAAVNPVTGDVYVPTRGSLVLVRGLDGDVIDLGLEALAVAVDVKRGVAYATTRDGQVAVLGGPDVVARLPAGHRPVDLAIDSETGRVYVANFGSDTITVIERESPPSVYLPFIRRSATNEE